LKKSKIFTDIVHQLYPNNVNVVDVVTVKASGGLQQVVFSVGYLLLKGQQTSGHLKHGFKEYLYQ
jgi:hypothetical protein